jgi:hypothetical protein
MIIINYCSIHYAYFHHCFTPLCPLGPPFLQFDSPMGPRTPLWGFSATFGHITLDRTPLDE